MSDLTDVERATLSSLLLRHLGLTEPVTEAGMPAESMSPPTVVEAFGVDDAPTIVRAHHVRYRCNPSTGPTAPVVEHHPDDCVVERCTVALAVAKVHAGGDTPWVSGLYRVFQGERGLVASRMAS